jgi:ubiquitin-like 1-activating enzyme E1 A
MRNATILVVRLKGTATEAVKNMVLAGIGKLVIVDSENVTEEDLGAGFLFRDEDVGKKVRFDHPYLLIRAAIYRGNPSWVCLL